MKMRNVLFAGLLALSPAAGALAQGGTNPDIKADSAKEANETKDGSVKQAQPGATGSTVVRGDHSAIAGDQKATDRKKSGGGGGDNN